MTNKIFYKSHLLFNKPLCSLSVLPCVECPVTSYFEYLALQSLLWESNDFHYAIENVNN